MSQTNKIKGYYPGIKCQKTNCKADAEVTPKIVIPCIGKITHDSDCDYEQSIIIGCELCRKHTEGITYSALVHVEFVVLISNLMYAFGHAPDFGNGSIVWIPLNSDEYKIYYDMKESAKTEHNQDVAAGKKLH